MKWLQEQTQTKMAILGRGSMKDKEKVSLLMQTVVSSVEPELPLQADIMDYLVSLLTSLF